MTPIHWINFYQRPLQGSTFFKRYPAFGYSHSIASVGGFDTMSCQLAMTRSEAESFFDRLGYEVSVYVDNPACRIWHGFLNRVTLTIGNITYTSSLDEMSNRVSGFYSAPGVSATQIQVTTQDSVDDSIDVYGIKEGFFDGYTLVGGTVGKMTALKTTIMNTHAWPQKSIAYDSAGGGANSLLQIECLGLYHTLQWERYFETGAGTADADVLISNVLTAGQTLYFDNTNTDYIVANGSFSQSINNRTGHTYWEWFQSIQEAGDGSNKWVMGVSAPEDTGGEPLFYYRESNTDIEYTIRSTDPKVRNVYGQIVPAWRVKPDRGCRIADVLTGWNGVGDDPATFYIDNISYNAEAQTVVFGSTDDLSLEGVFALKHYYNLRGKRFGVTRRQSTTP